MNNNQQKDLILTTESGATTLSFRPKPPPPKKNINELPKVNSNLNTTSPSRLRTSSEAPKRTIMAKFCKMPIIQPKVSGNLKLSNPKNPVKHQPPPSPTPKRSYTVSHGSISDKPYFESSNLNPINKEDAEDNDSIQQRIYGLKYKKDRKFIKQGSVHIEIFKSDNLIYQDNDIELFLFDDIFVLGRKSLSMNFTFYESVEYFSIEINNQSITPLSFELIHTGNKRFKFILKSEEEKEKWLQLINEQVTLNQKDSVPLKTNIFGKKLGYVKENSNTPSNETINDGKIEIPPWDPDDSYPNCYSCNSKFTSINRRHHCRNCGHVYIYLLLLFICIY